MRIPFYKCQQKLTCLASFDRFRQIVFVILFWIPCTSLPAQTPVDYVQPIGWSKYSGMTGVQAGDAFGQDLATLLQNHSRYMLSSVGTDYVVWNDDSQYPGAQYYYPFPNSNHWGYEQSLRPLSSFAYGTAAMLATGIYSESASGVSKADALHQIELAIRGVAFSHQANKHSGYRFGGRGTNANQWQAAYWASQTAEAAWMVWDDLSVETRTAVAKMVEDEANSFINYSVPYWNGVGGDTKAEKNAWNAHLPAVAQAMMPNHPNVELWREKASELQVSAFSRLSDNSDAALVDGRPVQDWINGFNMFENGVVVNHDRVHPDYLVSDFARYTTAVTASLAGQYIPESTFFNSDLVYQALTEVQFPPGASPYGSGSIVSPGGTIYRKSGTGDDATYHAQVYYPQGADWSLLVTDGYINTDLYAELLGLDAGKDFDSMAWAKARVEFMLALQNRSGHDGNIYQAGDWFVDYHSTDAVIYQANAEAWMLWWLMSNDMVSPIAAHWGAIPAPEPASLWLIATGVALVYASRKSGITKKSA